MPMDIDPRYANLIFKGIPHGIFTVDSERRVTSFNPAAEAITGWRQKEVLCRPCSEVFRSNHCAKKCFLQESIDIGEAHRDREVRIVHRHGEIGPLRSLGDTPYHGLGLALACLFYTWYIYE